MFCEKCGNKLNEVGAFCESCGAPVSTGGPGPSGRAPGGPPPSGGAYGGPPPSGRAPGEPPPSGRAPGEPPPSGRAPGGLPPSGGPYGGPPPSGGPYGGPPPYGGAYREPPGDIAPMIKKPMSKNMKLGIAGVALLGVLVAVAIMLVNMGVFRAPVYATEFTHVEFEGFDTMGEAWTRFDVAGFIGESFELTEEEANLIWMTGFCREDFERAIGGLSTSELREMGINNRNVLSSREWEELEQIMDSMEVEWSQTFDLTNGQIITVTITIDEEISRRVRGGEKEFTVSGLTNLMVITEAELAGMITVGFTGVDGRGVAYMEHHSTNHPILQLHHFMFVENGELSNGESVLIQVDSHILQTLHQNGYRLESDTFGIPVEGLQKLAQSFSDFSEPDELFRYLDENLARLLGEDDYTLEALQAAADALAIAQAAVDAATNSAERREANELRNAANNAVRAQSGTRWEKELVGYFYRPLAVIGQEDFVGVDTGWSTSLFNENDGTLIGIYTVTVFRSRSNDAFEEVDRSYTLVFGLTNLLPGDDGRVSITNILTVRREFDDSYSIETILRSAEDFGFTESVQR